MTSRPHVQAKKVGDTGVLVRIHRFDTTAVTVGLILCSRIPKRILLRRDQILSTLLRLVASIKRVSISEIALERGRGG